MKREENPKLTENDCTYIGPKKQQQYQQRHETSMCLRKLTKVTSLEVFKNRIVEDLPWVVHLHRTLPEESTRSSTEVHSNQTNLRLCEASTNYIDICKLTAIEENKTNQKNYIALSNGQFTLIQFLPYLLNKLFKESKKLLTH